MKKAMLLLLTLALLVSGGALADEAYRCAKGGVDLIKDDHGLMNQTFSDYKDRVKAVCEAVRQGNEESGHTPPTSPT